MPMLWLRKEAPEADCDFDVVGLTKECIVSFFVVLQATTSFGRRVSKPSTPSSKRSRGSEVLNLQGGLNS